MNGNDKLVVIHQPDFIPYLGFFNRLLLADIYVILDNVQFERASKTSWIHRDQIKTQGGNKWLTISTQKCHLDTKICDVKINYDTGWKKKHLNAIYSNYKKADGFKEVFPYIEKLYTWDGESLAEFNIESIKMLINLFDIKINTIKSSDICAEGKSNELIINILNKVGSHRYLSGIGARDYYDEDIYIKSGIEVIWQNFKHPEYQQQYTGFIPYLSSIDLLLNCGIEKSREILRSTI